MRVNKWMLAFITATFAAAPVLADVPTSEFNAKTSDTGVKSVTADAGQVEAPEKVISTPAADAAAPASQAPKTVIPGAKTKTIYVSPEKARELKASGKTKLKSEHAGDGAGSEHAGNPATQ